MKEDLMSSYTLKKDLKADGAQLVGIADLKVLNSSLGFDEKEFKQYIRAISIGVRLSNKIIDGIIEGPTKVYAEHYRAINKELDRIAGNLENKLKKQGYLAKALYASKRYDQKKLAARFPHKTAAILSGIGWIGRSALLISYEHGPRIRLVTVLTNAKIEADTPQKISNCGKCTLCVDHCPPQAITGKLWTFGDEREELFDAHKCNEHLKIKEKEVGETICGICIAVCPYGK